MKKLFYLILAMAVSIVSFSSCEDVPAPYDDPNGNHHGPEPEEGVILEESFASGFGSFTVSNVKGIPWTINYSTATATGYNSSDKTNTESESYLISPEIDLSDIESAHLMFEYIFRYQKNDGEDKVLITDADNYTGDPTTTNWEDMTGELTEGSDWNTFSQFDQNIPERFMGKKVIIALYYNASEKSSRTWEVRNLKVKEGEASEPVKPELPDDLTGSGTPEDPYTVDDALRIIQAYGQITTDAVYIKGFISSDPTIDTSFGNADYMISDNMEEGTPQLTVYRGYGHGNKQFTKNDEIKKGDELIICGQLVNFRGNTPEVTQGSWIYSLNGVIKSDEIIGESRGSGTANDPYNVVAALRYIKTLGADVESTEEIYVSGIVQSVTEFNKEFGNVTYYISDDGSEENVLYVYRGKGLNGIDVPNDKYLKAGDAVVVTGKVVNFRGRTPEFTQGNYLTEYVPFVPFTGTRENPLTIEQAKALGEAEHAWVKGYIVGYVEGDVFSENTVRFEYTQSVTTNVVIGAEPLIPGNTAPVVDLAQCMPVQLPRGQVRSAVNIPSNSSIGWEVVFYGSLGKWMNTVSVMAPTYVITPTDAYGTDPDAVN